MVNLEVAEASVVVEISAAGVTGEAEEIPEAVGAIIVEVEVTLEEVEAIIAVVGVTFEDVEEIREKITAHTAIVRISQPLRLGTPRLSGTRTRAGMPREKRAIATTRSRRRHPSPPAVHREIALLSGTRTRPGIHLARRICPVGRRQTPAASPDHRSRRAADLPGTPKRAGTTQSRRLRKIHKLQRKTCQPSHHSMLLRKIPPLHPTLVRATVEIPEANLRPSEDRRQTAVPGIPNVRYPEILVHLTPRLLTILRSLRIVVLSGTRTRTGTTMSQHRQRACNRRFVRLKVVRPRRKVRGTILGHRVVQVVNTLGEVGSLILANPDLVVDSLLAKISRKIQLRSGLRQPLALGRSGTPKKIGTTTNRHLGRLRHHYRVLHLKIRHPDLIFENLFAKSNHKIRLFSAPQQHRARVPAGIRTRTGTTMTERLRRLQYHLRILNNNFLQKIIRRLILFPLQFP